MWTVVEKIGFLTEALSIPTFPDAGINELKENGVGCSSNLTMGGLVSWATVPGAQTL